MCQRRSRIPPALHPGYAHSRHEIHISSCLRELGGLCEIRDPACPISAVRRDLAEGAENVKKQRTGAPAGSTQCGAPDHAGS